MHRNGNHAKPYTKIRCAIVKTSDTKTRSMKRRDANEFQRMAINQQNLKLK